MGTFTYLLLSLRHPTGSKTRIQPVRYQALLELHGEGVWERSLLSSRARWATGKKTARVTVLLGQFEATALMIEGLFAYKIEIITIALLYLVFVKTKYNNSCECVLVPIKKWLQC